MDADRFTDLLAEARARRLDRRALLRRGAALGLSASALAMLGAATTPVPRWPLGWAPKRRRRPGPAPTPSLSTPANRSTS
jgi:hypothetical protein